MSDLISRQAAMDEMSKQQTYKMFVGEDTVYLDANDVGSVLASLPSVQQWIPVSESLPDGRLNKSYLVQDKDGRLAVGTYTNWGWMFGHYMNDPVAWMPLPEPYERKES